MKKFAVIGNPIAHSRSPAIHQAFAEQLGIELSYVKIESPLDGFADSVKTFMAEGGVGMNVTVPFKLAACEFADEASEAVQLAEAANTLSFGKTIKADNTDGAGLVRDLRVNAGVELKGKRVLLLGAGGAARGVIKPLLECEPLELVVSNRSPQKPEALFEIFKDHGPMRPCTHNALKGDTFDVIINGTSASLHGQVPRLPPNCLAAGGACYDMVYMDGPTPFQTWAKAQGAGVNMDGLGMLVEQAAESFAIWNGQRPDTAPVMQQLRNGCD